MSDIRVLDTLPVRGARFFPPIRYCGLDAIAFEGVIAGARLRVIAGLGIKQALRGSASGAEKPISDLIGHRGHACRRCRTVGSVSCRGNSEIACFLRSTSGLDRPTSLEARSQQATWSKEELHNCHRFGTS